jgi:4-hydroxy-tetrahydrodipicolinate reductase
MRDDIRVLVLGTGQMGAGIARLLLAKPGFALVGAFGRRAERAGMDVGAAIGLGRDLGIAVGVELAALIERAQPDIAIQATCSRLADAMGEITMLVRHGVHVISIAEEMAYPACSSPAFAEELHWLAVSKGVAVLGTGVNPGFVLDLLVVTLSAVCADIESVTATRSNDLSPYGPSVLASQGVGLSPQAFAQGVRDGTVVGHLGFPESMHLIAAALGWDIERIEQTREPVVSRVRRETPLATVQPGQVAGCHHRAVAYCAGRAVITLDHPQQVHPQLEGVATGDRIEIRGSPNVCLSGSPEIPGGEATVALAVNMVPRVMNAPPGLHTMLDLPVPAALLGDARRVVRERA